MLSHPKINALRHGSLPTTCRLHAYVVLLTTGIRPEEARALRWDHLDLDAGTVAVWRSDCAGGDTKTPGSRRTLKLPDIALASLKERRTSTAELVYRRELRPVITTGAEIMDNVFSR